MAHSSVASLDTNVLLRLTLGDVPEQTKKAEVFITAHDTLHIADAALYEMVYVLEKNYQMVREDVATNILAIIRNPKYNCNRIVFEQALPVYVAAPKVSFIDCLLASYADINHTTPLTTFDQALHKVHPTHTELL